MQKTSKDELNQAAGRDSFRVGESLAAVVGIGISMDYFLGGVGEGSLSSSISGWSGRWLLLLIEAISIER